MKKNLYSFLFVLTILALNCISCSHSKTISADSGLTEEEQVSSSEGTTGDEASVSEEAEAKAEALVGDSGQTALDATASGESQPVEDATAIAMSPEDNLQVAQASLPATENAPLTTDASPSSFGALSNTAPSVPEATADSVVQKPEKKIRPKVKKTSEVVAPAPKAEVAPVEENKNNPPPVAVDDPFADELNAPIPEQEKEKPKLASAEIGSFVERHAFLVTLCAVGFVLGLFIFMRRRGDHDDHNLTV